MSFAFNLIWFVFGGLILGLVWVLLGLALCVTIIGIPFGIACFRIADFAFFPFGKDIVPAEIVGEKAVIGSSLGNLLWVIFFGFWLGLANAIIGIGYCCTIIGIPWGIASFNLAKASFAPLGKRVVSKEMAKVARERYAKDKLDKAMSKA